MEGLRGAISQGPGKAIFISVILIVFVVCMYYLYKWLNKGGDIKDYILYTSVNSGLPGAPSATTTPTKPSVYNSTNVPGLYSGGEFSISTWIYVTNWSGTIGNKPFLFVSGGPSAQYQTLALYLGQHINKLGVRVTYDTNSPVTREKMNPGASTSGPGTPYMDTDFKSCDIEQVPLQKWVNITVVLSGTTVDVYIDGKLLRSCVLPSIFLVDTAGTNASPTVVLGDPDGFTGLIGQTRAANFAYSPDIVYKYYQSGPFDNSILSVLWNYINPGAYSISIKKTS